MFSQPRQAQHERTRYRFRPHFIPEPDALFEQLKHSVLWDERMRARKTASFGVPYDYSQISYPAVPMPEALGQLCPAIERLLGFAPNNCLLNFYPDGQSSMGFHSDANEQLIAGTGVVVISWVIRAACCSSTSKVA